MGMAVRSVSMPTVSSSQPHTQSGGEVRIGIVLCVVRAGEAVEAGRRAGE